MARFNLSDAKEFTTYIDIPKGRYALEVMSAEERMSKSGFAMITLQCEIRMCKDPELNGRRIDTVVMLEGPGAGMGIAIAKAFIPGLTNDSELFARDFYGKFCEALVVYDTDRNTGEKSKYPSLKQVTQLVKHPAIDGIPRPVGPSNLANDVIRGQPLDASDLPFDKF